MTAWALDWCAVTAFKHDPSTEGPSVQSSSTRSAIPVQEGAMCNFHTASALCGSGAIAVGCGWWDRYSFRGFVGGNSMWLITFGKQAVDWNAIVSVMHAGMSRSTGYLYVFPTLTVHLIGDHQRCAPIISHFYKG